MSRLFKALLVLLISLPVIALVLMLEARPTVTGDNILTAEQLDAVQTFVIDHDPRAILRGQNRTITLTESVADSLLAYFLSESDDWNRVSARTELHKGQAELLASIPVNGGFFGKYLNLSVKLDDSSTPAHINQVNLGALHLPSGLIAPLLSFMDKRLANNDDYQLLLSLLDSIHDVKLEEDLASFSLQFNNQQISEVSNTARDLIFTPPQQSRVVDYYALIMETEATLMAEGNAQVGLMRFLQPLFQYAYDEVLDGQDPPQENRALFLAFSVYLTDLELSQVTAQPLEEAMLNHRRALRVNLNGRRDLAQHLVTSAAIASASGTALAQIISVYKEVLDSHTRSGFSFDDMTANAVGTALGDIATDTQSSAHRLQHAMKDITDVAEFMPPGRGENTLSAAEFNATYGSRQSEAYLQRVAEIEAGIASRPLFVAFDKTISLSATVP